MSTAVNIGLGLEKVFNAGSELASTVSNIGNDIIKQQGAIDAAYMQSQLDIDSAQFLEELSRKPAGTDFAAEIDNHMEKLRNQMSDPKSKYYAKNAYEGKMFEQILVGARTNLQKNGIALKAQKEDENTNLKADELVQRNRDITGATPERCEINIDIRKSQYEAGTISQAQYEEYKQKEYQATALDMAKTLYENRINEAASKNKDIQNSIAIGEAVVIDVTNELEQKFGENLSIESVKKYAEKGIESANADIAKVQKETNQNITKVNGDLIIEARRNYANGTNVQQTIVKLKAQQNAIRKYSYLKLTPEDQKQRIFELETYIDTLTDFTKGDNGSNSRLKETGTKVLSLQEIGSLMSKGLEPAMVEAFKEGILNPETGRKEKWNSNVYTFIDSYASSFGSLIEQACDDLRLKGQDENFIEMQKKAYIEKSYNDLFNIVQKSELFPPNVNKAINETFTFIKAEEKAGRMDSIEAKRACWDFLMGSSNLTDKDIEKWKKDYSDSLVAKNIDKIWTEKKGANQDSVFNALPMNRNKRFCELLQQGSNPELIRTDRFGNIEGNEGVINSIFYGQTSQISKTLLAHTFKVDATDIYQTFQISQEGNDIDPVLNFKIPGKEGIYRIVPDEKNSKPILEKSEDGKNWKYQWELDLNYADKELKEAQKAQKKKRENANTKAFQERMKYDEKRQEDYSTKLNDLTERGIKPPSFLGSDKQWEGMSKDDKKAELENYLAGMYDEDNNPDPVHGYEKRYEKLINGENK